jgi:intein/homing endonuclease
VSTAQYPSRCDSDLAEVIGLLLGDGCISRFFSANRTRLEVAFTGNLCEFDYYRGFVKRTIERHFPLKGQLILRGDNTVRLHYRSTRLASFLLSIGVPLGRKTDARIPEFVSRAGQDIAFVRGFYQAEGSLYRRYSRKYAGHRRIYSNLMVLQFRCKLKTLMGELRDVLLKLGLKPNRIGERDGVYTFRLTDQTEIQRFFKLVKPRYKKGLSKGQDFNQPERPTSP